MTFLRNIIYLYVGTWLLFAFFDFSSWNTVVAYQLRPVAAPAGYPDMIDVGPKKYRIDGQVVVKQVGDFEPSRYNDCAVINDDNWTCTYDDNSGKFGFRGGDYFTEALIESSIIRDDYVSVSRFGYVMNRVEWMWVSESWLDKATVLLVPFFV